MADLAQTVARWKESAGTGQSRYAEGVQATTVDVVGRAIAAKTKLLANFQQAVTSGRWESKLAEKGTAGWKAATIAKQSNYATGVAAGGDAFQKAMSTWLPIITSAAASVQAMPSLTIEDSAARSRAFMVALRNAKLAGA